jgi:hypothetical protein
MALMSFILLGLVSLATASARIHADIEAQEQRIAELRAHPGTPVDEQSFAGFDLSLSNQIKFNQVQSLITHNSYKKNITWETRTFFSAFSFIRNIRSSEYEHDNMTAQFNNGIRGVELDISYENGRFLVYHIKPVDTGSTCPDWELALEEIKIWSDNNPGHLPISVLVELKDASMSSDRLRLLDDSVRRIMGEDKLITPALLMGDNDSLSKVAANKDWILLSEVMGKVMFILHPHEEATANYIRLDPSLRSLSFVPMFSYDDFVLPRPDFAPHYLLIKEDKLDIGAVRPLVAAGYMVRVRMDAPLRYAENNKKLAVDTGAQLISTDYEPGVILPEVDYTGVLTGGKTSVLQSPYDSYH